MPRVKRTGPTPTPKHSRWWLEERAVLRGEPCPDGGNPFRHLMLSHGDVDELALAWDHWGSDLTAEWIAERPGTRTVGWLVFAAPHVIESFAHNDVEDWLRKADWSKRLYQGPPPEKEQIRRLRKHDLLGPEELKPVQRLGTLTEAAS